MEASEFRTTFASFVGPIRYRQFVRFLNGEGRWRGRFLFWQEEFLTRFAAAHPSADRRRDAPLFGAVRQHAHDPQGAAAENPASQRLR